MLPMNARPAVLRPALAAGAMAAALLSACVTDQSGAGDGSYTGPVNVDARTSGQALAADRAYAADWDAQAALPSTPVLPASVSTQVGALAKAGALSKLSAAGEAQPVFDVTDTAKGYATVTWTEQGLFTKTTAVAKVKWDAQAKDTVKDNENLIAFVTTKTSPGKVETAEFADADGDGVLNAASPASRVRITFTSAHDGVVEKAVVVATPGADADFRTDADNEIVSADYARLRGGDTVAVGAYSDADHDGVILSKTKASSLVGLRFWEADPADKPLARKVTGTATVRVGADGSQTPVTLAYEEDLKTGRHNSVALINSHGGDTLIAGDTTTVRLLSEVSTGDDTLKRLQIDFVMNPGQRLDTNADDSLYAIHIAAEKKLGWERSATFDFIPSAPVPQGQKPVAGRFDGEITYANGETASLDGQFSATGYTATWKGRKGGTLRVEYDQDGNLVSSTKVTAADSLQARAQ